MNITKTQDAIKQIDSFHKEVFLLELVKILYNGRQSHNQIAEMQNLTDKYLGFDNLKEV